MLFKSTFKIYDWYHGTVRGGTVLVLL